MYMLCNIYVVTFHYHSFRDLKPENILLDYRVCMIFFKDKTSKHQFVFFKKNYLVAFNTM